MCGIVGYIGQKGLGRAIAEEMNTAQKHGGPDGSGVFESNCGRVHLGMSRLSIIDLKNGVQPMTIDDGDFTIVFNGEIFNSAELRTDLANQFNEGFETSHSDTEVLVRLFKHYGPNCFQKLNGMFALAIFSRKAQTVTLARDYFGIKPLLYAETKDGLLFASELRALRGQSGVDSSHSKASLSEYLDFGYVNAPRTIFNGIKRLEAGHFAELNLNSGELNIQPWKVSLEAKAEIGKSGRRDIARHIGNEMRSALGRWLIADVPVCYSLSGGLDSSALVGIASAADHALATYSVGYRDKDLEMWDEVPIASRISKEIGSTHTEVIIKLDEIEDDLAKIASILCEPYGGGLPSYYLFQAANKNDHKVMITGVGGDEMFGNYSNAMKMRRTFPGRQFFDTQYYIDLMYRGRFKGFDVPTLKSDDLSQFQWQADALLQSSLSKATNLEEAVYLFDESTQLPNEFLSMVDLFSMNFGVEARTPFLDREFSRLMLSIPAELRSTPDNYKSLLVESVGPLMPKQALGLAKSGFSLPLSVLMRKTCRDLFLQLMSERSLKSAGLYHNDLYHKLVVPFLNGENRFVSMVWRVFFLQFWFTQASS